MSESQLFPVVTTVTADHTAALADAPDGQGVILVNSAADTNQTIPPNSAVAFPIGTVLEYRRLGTGAVTLVAGAGVTIEPNTNLSIAAQHTSVSLLKTGTDTWALDASSGGGAISSVFGRTGAVVAQQGDYAANYMPQLPNVVAPPGMANPETFNNGSNLAALTPRGVRVIVPKAGTLHDLSWMPVTVSGNCAVAIYDTGDAAGSGIRTLLYSSGSLAVGTSNQWQQIDPALAVLAGQQLDFMLMADNSTATFFRWLNNSGQVNTSKLPTSFGPVAGGASPIYLHTIAAVASLTSWPATIADASVTPFTQAPILIARVA